MLLLPGLSSVRRVATAGLASKKLPILGVLLARSINYRSFSTNQPGSIPNLKIRPIRTQLRPFSSSITSLYRRAPMNHTPLGPLGQIWSQIPDWVKLCGGITLGAYLFISVALPVMIVVLPPLLIGGFFFTAGNKVFRRRRETQQWELLKDSTLIFKPSKGDTMTLLSSPEKINAEIARFEINRIIDAFWANEKGMADFFRVGSATNLALGQLESVHYGYDSDSSLLQDDFSLLVTQQRVLWDTSVKEKIATCVLSLKCLEPLAFESGVDPTANIGKSTCVIEINPLRFGAKKYIIDTPSLTDAWDTNDEIIDVKGTTRDL